jgi:protein O-mannosyl-transferase
MSRPSLKTAAPALVAGVVTLALYAVTLGGTYIYDDVALIANDKRIQSVENWKQLWTTDYFNGGVDNLYRPLTSQTFALQWWLHGDRPWAFHLVNLLLGAAVAAGVAELARRLAGLRTAWVAGLLFAAHPLHVEAVAEIVGRGDELCAFFIILALILFLPRPLTTGRACAISLCAIAAMLSKEQGMLLPGLLLVLGLLIRWRSQSQAERLAVLLLTLILCWSVAGLIVLREDVLNLRFTWNMKFLDFTIQPMINSTPGEHALMVLAILGRYVQLLIAPVKLSIDYGLNVLSASTDWRDPYVYAGIAAVVVWIVAVIRALWRGARPAAFCLIAAAMMYSMVSNVFLIGTIFGERLMYLPSVFLLIWAGILLARMPTAGLVVVMTALVALGGWRTVRYAERWNNRYQFYVTSLAEQPESVRLNELLITEMIYDGDLSGAAKLAAATRNLRPDYWDIWRLSAQIAERQGDLDTALSMYRRALKLQLQVPLKNKIEQLEVKIAEMRAHGTAEHGMGATRPVNSEP